MDTIDLERSCNQIIACCDKWARFWPNSCGWAPLEAASIMTAEKMDRQLEMAHSLNNWPKRLASNQSDGELILAWANLGCLVEGALKFYFISSIEDWKLDEQAPKNRDASLLPSDTYFGRLIEFSRTKKLFKPSVLDVAEKIQHQRNLIHPFKSGTVLQAQDFFDAIGQTATLFCEIEMRLRYPDD